MVRDFDLLLDQAIDGLVEPSTEDGDDLAELAALAEQLQRLPEADWPDAYFPDRLTDGVGTRIRNARNHDHRRRRWLVSTVGLAAAAAVALGLMLTQGSSSPPPAPGLQPVTAQQLAAKAEAVSTGIGLGPVRFTDVVTSHPSSGVFQPAPPPAMVTETVTFASASRWRVDAVIVEANGAGTARRTTVRDGTTIAAESTSPSGVRDSWIVTTNAGLSPELPDAGSYGMLADPAEPLVTGTGRCARTLSLGGQGPAVAGEATRVLRVGANPCPSAAIPQIDGPASFLVDARTSLVLQASVYASAGDLLEQSRVTALAYGGSFSAGLFTLPKPPTTRPSTPQPATTVPTTPATTPSSVASQAILVTELPAGLRQGPITPEATDPKTGRTTSFSVTYSAGGRPAVQLYEAPAASTSVRFPGRPVELHPGITATVSISAQMTILWWIQDNTYLSLQQGGESAGVPLSGHLSESQLVAMAASAK